MRQLVTGRLILRLPEPREAADIMVMANNPRISAMTARMPYPYGLKDALAFIASCAADAGSARQGSFGIYRKAARPELIGICGIAVLPREAQPELGYWVAEPHWGKGYASEAAGAMLAFAFDKLGLRELQARCRVDNPASRAVLEKLGFRHRGTGLIYAFNRRRHETVDRFDLTVQGWRAGARP